MGRENVLAAIKKRAKIKLIVGILFTILGAFGTLVMILAITGDNYESGMATGLIFMVTLLIAGIITLVLGIKDKVNPAGASVFKKNQKLLEMADELYANILYQDKDIIFSDKIVANATDILSMTYTNEVIVGYIREQRTNGILTLKCLHLDTINGQMEFNLMKKKQEEIDYLARTVCSICPFIRFGFTTENSAYLEHMRNMYDEAHKNDR